MSFDAQRYAVLGRVGRPHGVDGEVTLDPCDLEPGELLAMGDFMWRGPGGETRPLTLASARHAGSRSVLRFSGIEDRDTAASLTGGDLLVERAKLPDPGPDKAYAFQLLGLRVVTQEGRELGTVTEVQQAAQPIYVVTGDKQILIPATPAFVKSVDLAEGVVTVSLPEGLEDL